MSNLKLVIPSHLITSINTIHNCNANIFCNQQYLKKTSSLNAYSSILDISIIYTSPAVQYTKNKAQKQCIKYETMFNCTVLKTKFISEVI